MVTTIGKKILVAGVFYAPFLFGSITLEVTNGLGIPLSSIQVGSPFFITLTAKQAASFKNWPLVKSLEKVHIIGHRVERKKTKANSSEDEQTLIYTALADTPGTYTFSIDEAKGKTITVIEGTFSRAQNSKPVYTLSIPPKKYVVGEQIPFTLSFTSQQAENKLMHLETIPDEGLKVGYLSAGAASVTASNNELTSHIDFEGYFYPTKAGELVIPPLRADYTSQPSGHSSFARAFLLGFAPDAQTVYTQQKKLFIDPLPATSTPTSLVGELHSYTAALSSLEAKRGEALLLTLALEGKTNFDALDSLQVAVPEGIRSYESKSALQRTPFGEKKEWEFVLQGLKEGSYVLPPQKLRYFDTKVGTYKEISTKSIPFTITPGIMPTTEASTKKSPQASSLQEKNDALKKSSNNQVSQKTSPLEIPELLFWILMSIPLVGGLFMLLYKKVTSFALPYIRRAQERKLLAQAAYRITGKKEDPYTVLKDTMISYLHIAPTATLEEMVRALEVRGFQKEELFEWEELYNSLLKHSSYAPYGVTEPPSLELLKRSQAWLDHLKKNQKSRLVGFFFVCSYACSLDALEPLSNYRYYSFLETLSSFLPFGVWQLLVLITWFSCWYCIYSYRRKAALISGILCICAFLGWAPQARVRYLPSGHILKDGVSLYLSPYKNAIIREKFQAGETVTIAQKKDLWYYVFSSRGKGWINAEDVAVETRS